MNYSHLNSNSLLSSLKLLYFILFGAIQNNMNARFRKWGFLISHVINCSVAPDSTYPSVTHHVINRLHTYDLFIYLLYIHDIWHYYTLCRSCSVLVQSTHIVLTRIVYWLVLHSVVMFAHVHFRLSCIGLQSCVVPCCVMYDTCTFCNPVWSDL